MISKKQAEADREEAIRKVIERPERYGNEAACVLGKHQAYWRALPPENGWPAKHRDAWSGSFANAQDRMFRTTIEAIVATGDAVGGPDGDYLIRPFLLSLIRMAECQLNYLGALDGATCWALLNDLCRVWGFTLDNIPEN